MPAAVRIVVAAEESFTPEPPKRVVFDKPGQADVFCTIHTKMHCIVLVLTNPWFAATGDKGSFTIRDVPAGTYRLRAWHERLPAQVKEITVPDFLTRQILIADRR